MDKFLFWGRWQSVEWSSKGWWTLGSFWGSLIELPIFVTQRAVAPKNGVEFHQKSIGAFRCSLAMSYNYWRRCMTSMKLTGTDRWTDGQIDRTMYWVRLTPWLKSMHDVVPNICPRLAPVFGCSTSSSTGSPLPSAASVVSACLLSRMRSFSPLWFSSPDTD